MVVEWLWRSVICPFTLRFHKSVLIPDLQIKALLRSLCHLLILDCDWLLSLRTLGSLHPPQSLALPWHGSNVWKTRRGTTVLPKWPTNTTWPTLSMRRSTERRQENTPAFLKTAPDWLHELFGDMILGSRTVGAGFRVMWAQTPTCCAVYRKHWFSAFFQNEMFC